MVERTYGNARRIWVMEPRHVSEENLRPFSRREVQYLMGAAADDALNRVLPGRLGPGASRDQSQSKRGLLGCAPSRISESSFSIFLKKILHVIGVIG